MEYFPAEVQGISLHIPSGGAFLTHTGDWMEVEVLIMYNGESDCFTSEAANVALYFTLQPV